MSPKTPLNILQGSVTIMIAMIWTALGLYAKSLCKRLFRYQRFVQDIRMHARTIFKVNAALLVFLLGLFFIAINDVDSKLFLDPKTCEVIELPYFVCSMHFVAKMIFSVISLIWNTLVAIVLISLCRTHTIGLRRFIKELEDDALMYDNINCRQFKEFPMTREDVCEETFWLEEEQSLEEDSAFIIVKRKSRQEKLANITPDSGMLSDNQEVVSGDENLLEGDTYLSSSKSPASRAEIGQGPGISKKGSSGIWSNLLSDELLDDSPDINIKTFELSFKPDPYIDDKRMDNVLNTSGEIIKENELPNEVQGCCTQTTVDVDFQPACSSFDEENLEKMREDVNISNEEPLADESETVFTPMTPPEILHKYWKINCRLRATSCIFQRWIASFMALVILWCVVYLLRWQDEKATIYDILQFIIPLVLLPLLCSAFAEVNMEGVRMLKCIFPIEERLPLLRFMQQNPLQMTIFNVSLSYGTIMTVVFAIFVAFTSRLIFTEIQG